MQKPPILSLPKTRQTMILNLCSIAALAAAIAIGIYGWMTLPDRFPIHFGFDGKPNEWGGKTVLLWLPLTGIVIYVGLTILVRFPHAFNYLVKITETNALRQYQIACSMINWLKAECLWIYAYLQWQIVNLATSENPSLGLWFLPFSVILVFGTIAYWLWQSILAR